jgi:hypothetical protein
MKIYQILENGYLGEITTVSDDTKGIPFGWTRTGFTFDVPSDHYVIWTGDGWHLTIIPSNNDDTGLDK